MLHRIFYKTFCTFQSVLRDMAYFTSDTVVATDGFSQSANEAFVAKI